MFQLTLNMKAFQNAMRLLKTLPGRMEGFMRRMTYDYARLSMKAVLGYVPRDLESRRYRKSFEVAEIVNLPSRSFGYAITVKPKTRDVRSSDASRTLLYVKPKASATRIPPNVQALIDYSPWPMDMLPFTPSHSLVSVISRQVRADEVTAIREMRQKDKAEWSHVLARSGRRETKQQPVVRLPRALKAQPDVVFQALRMEYGLGAERSSAHWRPGIRTIVSKSLYAMIRKQKWDRYFDPDFKAWGRRQETRRQVSFMETKKYQGFQKRLGIRIGGTK